MEQPATTPPASTPPAPTAQTTASSSSAPSTAASVPAGSAAADRTKSFETAGSKYLLLPAAVPASAPSAAPATTSTGKRLDGSALLSPPDQKAPRVNASSPPGPILPISEQTSSGGASSSSGPPLPAQPAQPAPDLDKTIEYPASEDPDRTVGYPAEDLDNRIEYPVDDLDKTIEYPAESSDTTKSDHYAANNFVSPFPTWWTASFFHAWQDPDYRDDYTAGLHVPCDSPRRVASTSDTH